MPQKGWINPHFDGFLSNIFYKTAGTTTKLTNSSTKFHSCMKKPLLHPALFAILKSVYDALTHCPDDFRDATDPEAIINVLSNDLWQANYAVVSYNFSSNLV